MAAYQPPLQQGTDSVVVPGMPQPPQQPHLRKTWRGGLFDCFGDCSASDFGSCCLVFWVPFIAFGQNMRKAFGMSFIKQMLLVLLCLYGAQFFAGLFAAVDCGPPPVTVSPLGDGATSDAVVNSTDVEAAHQYNSCMVKWNVLDLLYIPLTLGFLVYAAYRRNQMRKRFNIPGDEWEDYFSWLCCGPCALCQETRTLAGNSVEDGLWPGDQGNCAGEKQPLIFGSPNFVKRS